MSNLFSTEDIEFSFCSMSKIFWARRLRSVFPSTLDFLVIIFLAASIVSCPMSSELKCQDLINRSCLKRIFSPETAAVFVLDVRLNDRRSLIRQEVVEEENVGGPDLGKYFPESVGPVQLPEHRAGRQ